MSKTFETWDGKPLRMTNHDNIGHSIPIDEFMNSVRRGSFIDYDGFGYFATATQESNIEVFPSMLAELKPEDFPEWATHIRWFNR
jgi:hypothetical protein